MTPYRRECSAQRSGDGQSVKTNHLYQDTPFTIISGLKDGSSKVVSLTDAILVS